MLRYIAPLAMLVAGCDGSKAPVDTTAASEELEPAPAMATLSGELQFPSDYIPSDIRVCAEASSGTTLCDAQFTQSGSGRTYRLDVPAGSYRVFAQTAERPGTRAYYSDFVVCGMDQGCLSHEPVMVAVAAGEMRNGVHPNDWYVPAAQATASAAGVAVVDAAIPTDDWSPTEAAIIKAWYDLNSKCRGGSGDEATTMAACEERDTEMSAQLTKADICYGKEGEFGAEMEMHRCAANSLR